MRIPINLGSQPFRRDRPVIIASLFLALVLVFLLGGLVSLEMSQRAQMADVRRSISQLNRRVQTISAEQAKLDTVLRKPENAQVLERSIFLNELLQRKGISWTRIFADLETAVPHNVRIISIRPSVNLQNQITLDMLVGTESPEPVIEMLKTLIGSPLFGAAFVQSTMPPSQTEPLYRYRMSVNYAQKL